MERRAFLAAATAGALGVVGCLGRSEGSYDVGMTPTSFEPVSITVDAGDEVVWENTSSRGHTVTATESELPDGAAYFASGDFESEAAARDAWRAERGGYMAPGERFSHRFEVPGHHGYVCLPHESGGMVGTVVVEE